MKLCFLVKRRNVKEKRKNNFLGILLMSKPGKSFENNKRIILTKLENTVCGNMERLCSKPILDGYNARLRELGIRSNIYDFYIKKGEGYKLKKNYKSL